MLRVRSDLVLVGSWNFVSAMVFAQSRGLAGQEAYNRLPNSSILLLTALVNRIIIQMLVKLVFRHNALGISAGKPRFTR